jgi:hypothetical protein
MATTDLKLDEPGTLPRPGPVGRIVRLGLGLLCLSFVVDLLLLSGGFLDGLHINQIIWTGLIMGLFLSSYIINIGYSRSWKKWPAISSGLVFLVIGLLSYVESGTFESNLLGQAIWIWTIYLFTHLGAAFTLSGLIGTPGCEMRAFHDLFSRLTGISTKEHYCPVGPLHPIDQWEIKQAWVRRN